MATDFPTIKQEDDQQRPDRKSKLDILHFKAVCFQRTPRLSLFHAQDARVYAPLEG